MLLMWDAMGYNCGIRYDKQTGQLIGLSEDFHFGLCVQRFSNKVNVLKVISPQEDISICFPICHHHVHTLNRYIVSLCVIIIVTLTSTPNFHDPVLRSTLKWWTSWKTSIISQESELLDLYVMGHPNTRNFFVSCWMDLLQNHQPEAFTWDTRVMKGRKFLQSQMYLT